MGARTGGSRAALRTSLSCSGSSVATPAVDDLLDHQRGVLDLDLGIHDPEDRGRERLRELDPHHDHDGHDEERDGDEEDG